MIEGVDETFLSRALKTDKEDHLDWIFGARISTPHHWTPKLQGVFRRGDGIIEPEFLKMNYLDSQFEQDPVIEAYKKDIDRTLIRENLKLTVQQRIDKLIGLIQFQEKLRAAARKAEENK